ncbi:MAG TPA: thiamine phosphate synthase [Candidatus Acidoferrum sp.]|nr:thiamine phosphate synthase [Candidatus Acidoferrum sp.]
MRKPDKPIVCYVTDSRSLTASAAVDPVEAVLEKIQLAIDAGVHWIQIREKGLPGRRLLKLTRNAIAAAGDPVHKVPATRTRIFVNDRLDVALAAGVQALATVAGLPAAAGIHLGGDSLPVEQVVRWCRAGNAPPEFQVGLSTHSIDQAREAERAGADYIFFGPVFDTPSKRPFGPPQGLDRLGEICRAIQVPVIAIGGIDQSNAQLCIRAGASGVAAIRLFQDAANRDELVQLISTITQGNSAERQGGQR